MKEKLLTYLNNRHVILMIALLFMGYIAFNTIGIISRNYRLQRQVDDLKEEIEILKLENQELEFKIAYYRTDAFVDKEARDKLGMQTSGEKVLVFPSKVPSLTDQTELTAAKLSAAKQAVSNFEQWMYFLFRRNPSSN